MERTAPVKFEKAVKLCCHVAIAHWKIQRAQIEIAECAKEFSFPIDRKCCEQIHSFVAGRHYPNGLKKCRGRHENRVEHHHVDALIQWLWFEQIKVAKARNVAESRVTIQQADSAPAPVPFRRQPERT